MKLHLLSGFHDEDLVSGSEKTRRSAREQLRRQQWLTAARGSGLPELDPQRIRRSRFGTVTDQASGTVYRVHRSDLPDPQHRGLAGYFVDDGQVTYLEELPPTRQGRSA